MNEEDGPKEEDSPEEREAEARERETEGSTPGVHGEEKVIFREIPTVPGMSETHFCRCTSRSWTVWDELPQY